MIHTYNTKNISINVNYNFKIQLNEIFERNHVSLVPEDENTNMVKITKDLYHSPGIVQNIGIIVYESCEACKK